MPYTPQIDDVVLVYKNNYTLQDEVPCVVALIKDNMAYLKSEDWPWASMVATFPDLHYIGKL